MVAVPPHGELLLELDALEAAFSVRSNPSADGTVSFDGFIRRLDGGISSASGSGAVFIEGATHWITGDLEFVRPDTDPPRTEAVRFSMRR